MGHSIVAISLTSSGRSPSGRPGLRIERCFDMSRSRSSETLFVIDWVSSLHAAPANGPSSAYRASLRPLSALRLP